MTPAQIVAKSNTEHSHQVAFFVWCSQQKVDERLKMAFAVPNGGLRDKVTASRMKAEGVRKGVPDVMIPIPIGNYHGLFIEFKVEKGKLSAEQVVWQNYLQSQGYAHFVAYGYLSAMDATLQYLLKYPVPERK